MISIIVPIYNGASFLDECVQSVLQQDSNDWELLLVDDGSTDATPKICQGYLHDRRVRYFRKENSGVQETRWFGVQQAKYNYVTFLDADDLLLPSTIGVLCKHLGEVDVITFGMQNFSTEDEIDENLGSTVMSEILTDKMTILKRILSGKLTMSSVWGSVYSTQMLSKCEKLFCNNLKIGEDTMFNTEFVYAMSPRVGVVSSQFYCYRTNLNSVTHTYDKKRHAAVYNTITYLENFLVKNQLSKALRHEAGFRLLLLWSSFMFHPNNEYYYDKTLRKRMRSLYFPAFKFLFPYLKVYLFIDLFIWKLEKRWK